MYEDMILTMIKLGRNDEAFDYVERSPKDPQRCGIVSGMRSTILRNENPVINDHGVRISIVSPSAAIFPITVRYPINSITPRCHISGCRLGLIIALVLIMSL